MEADLGLMPAVLGSPNKVSQPDIAVKLFNNRGMLNSSAKVPNKARPAKSKIN